MSHRMSGRMSKLAAVKMKTRKKKIILQSLCNAKRIEIHNFCENSPFNNSSIGQKGLEQVLTVDHINEYY